MPVDRGFVNNTTDGIWDIAGVWDGTTAWPEVPDPDGYSLVGHWDADVWDGAQAIWGPAQSAGTKVKSDEYGGDAYWDSGVCWDTDFWLTWD